MQQEEIWAFAARPTVSLVPTQHILVRMRGAGCGGKYAYHGLRKCLRAAAKPSVASPTHPPPFSFESGGLGRPERAQSRPPTGREPRFVVFHARVGYIIIIIIIIIGPIDL